MSENNYGKIVVLAYDPLPCCVDQLFKLILKKKTRHYKIQPGPEFATDGRLQAQIDKYNALRPLRPTFRLTGA